MKIKGLLLIWLSLFSFAATSQSTIQFPANGNIATEDWVQNYVFDMMEKYVKADCDLIVTSATRENGEVSFGLTTTLQGVNNYTIKAQKGEYMQFWNAVPYTAGQLIRITNVPELDSIRFTIRPTYHPTCYVSYIAPLGGGIIIPPNPGDTTTTPTVPVCEAGPTLLSIYNVTQDGLTAQFHGNGVTQLSYKIKDPSNGATLRTGIISPQAAVLNISFSSPLPYGSYTLRFDGVNCTGFSEKDFAIINSGSDPDPPTGDVVAKYIVKSFPEHINIVVNGTGSSKTITDAANFSPPSGYEFWYFVNDRIIKQGSRLVNLPWPSDVPVGIMKVQAKIGLSTLNKWECPTDGYYDCDAGRTFSNNVSVAFTSIIFEQSGGGYDVSKKVVQWMDYMADMPKPAADNDVWIMPIGPISTPEQLTAKGVTHFSKFEITGLSAPAQQALMDGGRTYDEVPTTPVQLSLPDRGSGSWVPSGQNYPQTWNTRFFDYVPGQSEPLSVEQGALKGNQYSIAHAVQIFENSEQDHAIGTQWAFWRSYYDALSARLQAKFPGKWRLAHNYFTSFSAAYPNNSTYAAKISAYGESPFTLGYASRAQHKAFLATGVGDFPPSELNPGGTLASTNTVCFGIYLNAPDLTIDVAYRLIYQSEISHKASKYIFAFMQSFYEYKPNNLNETVFPEGKFYQYIKPPHNPAQVTNYAFLSRVFADGFVPFSAASKTSGVFAWDKQWWGQSLWIPNGYSTPQDNTSFPYWQKPGQKEAFPTTGFENYVADGMRKWYNSFGQTIGGTRYYLRYRIDGGAWVEPQNNNSYDLVDAYFDKRAIVYGEVKSGKMAVMYLNPYADGAVHTIEFKNPTTSATYTMSVASSIVQEKLVTL